MTLNEKAILAGKLLPLFRTRLFKGDPNCRIWTFKDLSDRTLVPANRVKSTVLELEKRAGAVFQMYPGGVRFIGPDRLDLATAFKPGAAPCTALAKAFRKHGVRLEKNLTPSTSWCQKSNLSSEFVLTLDSNTIKYKNGKDIYDCSRKFFPEQTWEALPASHARMKCLRRVFKDDAFVRVIRVDIREFPDQPAKILDAEADDCFWKITRLDEEGNRFAAERSKEKARLYPLSMTELS